MKWIGLTGGIASGKSSVAALLRRHGFQVAEADRLAHDVIRSGQPAFMEIIRRFGPQIIDGTGEIDRAALGKIVFSDSSARIDLENIIHPRVRELTQRLKDEWRQQGVRVAFYEVPLLFEKNMDADFDAIWVVDLPEVEQVARLQARTGLSVDEAKKRILAQVSRAERVRRATELIDNSGTVGDLERQVARLVASL
ncbi:MAG TPA: dephospho-CoA kinase [Pseudobdellovibrionaceae bacterium]|nr:dephospho-CoA kinase [Pseudobdellovibrionaceae bacterium]